MVYYDTTTKQLLTYSNGKWQSDRSTATKIVAASNSSQAIKDSADYIATGTGDQATINSALTAAAGGKVYLAEGTYTLGTTAISVPNNTTLAGVGVGTVLTFASGTGTGTYNAITNSDTTTGTHVTIRDLLIEGNKTGQTAGTFNGIYFNGMGSGAIRDGGVVTNVVVQNIYGSNSQGIYINNSANTEITDSIVRNGDQSGIYVNLSANNVISGTILEANSWDGITMSGSSSVNNSITGNTILGNSGSGISLLYSTSAPSGNSITGNIIKGSLNGISMSSGSNNSITGNTVQGNSTYGIALTYNANGNTITGNKVDDNGGSTTNNGIYVGQSGTPSKNTITGNDITDTSCTTNCYAITIAAGSYNYLADNRFSSTPGTATINDTGTGTVYANQSRAENGRSLLIRTANSTTAFAIQNATGTSMLNVDTTNNLIQIGSNTTDATAVLHILDSYNNGTDPTGYNGAMYYNTSTSKFRCYQASAWTDCVATASGANTALSNIASTNLSAALNVTAGNLTLQTTTSGDINISPVGTINLNSNTVVTGTLTNNNSALVKTTSTIALQVQNASAAVLFTVDTSTSTITFGTGSDKVIFTAAGGLVASGTARHSKTLRFTPEYAGAVLDAQSDSACTAASNGTMTAGYDSTGRTNYYNWTSVQTSDQCYDVVTQVPIPTDFDTWNSINVQAKTSNASNSAYGIAIIDSGGSFDANYGSGYAAPGTLTTSWSNVATSSLSGTYTAGDYFTIKIRMSAKNSANLQLGNITLNYNSKF
jgi:parallel beta-helix repeat protein